MTYLNDETIEQLKEYFKDLDKDVHVIYFNAEGAQTGEETATILREITSIHDKLHLEEKDLEADKDLAAEYGVEMSPSYVLLDQNRNFTRVRFNGIPLGHEINSFLSALVEVGGNPPAMPEEMKARIAKIDKPVNIKVFVTLGCPHCPGAVQKAHALALANPNIQAEMVEAQTFSELSEKFNVSSVPQIVFNDSESFLGNLPFEEFIKTAELVTQ
ncbi:MAG: glutaredoxin [Clostridia bacterium]|nr:glutaredoxin [Clostridia bacterium]NLF20655.1 glutaredoxin [Clostridiaceae bacterium]